jgi:hypothetical protein
MVNPVLEYLSHTANAATFQKQTLVALPDPFPPLVYDNLAELVARNLISLTAKLTEVIPNAHLQVIQEGKLIHHALHSLLTGSDRPI